MWERLLEVLLSSFKNIFESKLCPFDVSILISVDVGVCLLNDVGKYLAKMERWVEIKEYSDTFYYPAG